MWIQKSKSLFAAFRHAGFTFLYLIFLLCLHWEHENMKVSPKASPSQFTLTLWMASFAVQFCDLHFHRTGVGASFGSGRLTPVDIKFSLQFFHQGQQVIPVGKKRVFSVFHSPASGSERSKWEKPPAESLTVTFVTFHCHFLHHNIMGKSSNTQYRY